MRDGPPHTQPGGGRAATVFVVVALSAALALLTVAVVARLRDPRAMAPKAGDLSELLGTGRRRPSWRVVVIGLVVMVGWLLIVLLLSRLSLPHGEVPVQQAPEAAAAPHGAPPSQAPRTAPSKDTGTMLGMLLAATVLMLLVLVTGTILMSRRKARAVAPHPSLDDGSDDLPSPQRSECLVRAAELGLAEMADLTRDPREAIIACYAAMERELANFPGAAPQEFDTPTEVLARAVELRALHRDNAAELVNLFEEARFSPHVMRETHRDAATHVLRLVLGELRSPA